MALVDYVERIVYDAGGHTGSTYYIRIVRRSDGYIWDASALAYAATPVWEDSAIAIAETDEAGQFPVIIPSDLPAGVVDVIVYKQSGSSPANTDDVQEQWTVTKGSIFGF